jgi:predicted dehydrogenase
VPAPHAAVLGLGYWGPNLARNFQASNDFELACLCDSNAQRLKSVAVHYPWAKTYESVETLLREGKPEIVAIATPVGSHYALAKACLEAGVHVLCEKPLAATVKEASELVELAAKKNVKLFVDHTFTYTDAVRKIKELYTGGTLGDLFYIDSVRINLGLFQPDVDVVWDLAPHDLSILRFIVDKPVKTVQVAGAAHNPRSLADVAYVGLDYGDGLIAYLHLSWLSPVKVRRMIFSGTKSSLLFDDLDLSEKIKIYDHGVSFDFADLETRKQVLVNYRRGDMRAPALNNREALGTELKEIAAALAGKPATVTVGEDGLEVVRVLEASQRSLREDGKRIPV